MSKAFDIQVVNSYIGASEHYRPGNMSEADFNLAYEDAKRKAISDIKSRIRRIEALTLADHKKHYRICETNFDWIEEQGAKDE